MKISSDKLKKARIVIPTYNAAKHLAELIPALRMQRFDPAQLLVIDSSSSDSTVDQFTAYGAQVLVIPQKEFNHGGTRRFAAQECRDAKFLIFMTQDAIPATPNAFEKLLAAFSEPKVGMAYGRQMPRPQARSIERHARLINYPPDKIETRIFEDRKRWGIKTVFCSDSFAAYRTDVLEAIGNFPQDAFFGEDQITAGKILLAGSALRYQGDACVTHSHGYSVLDDFKRYFDVGVFHSRNFWLIDTFGHAEGEGLKFVLSELKYLAQNEPTAIPSALARTLAKYIGYRIGLMEKHMSPSTKTRLSMNRHYWQTKTPLSPV